MISTIKRSALAWEHWWTREGPPQLMAIVRIVMGGWLLFYWGIRVPNVSLLYSNAGIVLPDIPTYLPESLHWLLTDIPSPAVALGIFSVHLLLLFFVFIGFETRISASLAFVTSWYYFYLSHHLFHTSYDRLYIVSLLFLAISNSGETFSVYAWQKYGSPLRWQRMTSIFSQRLFAFQITATYFGVGFQKLWLPDWQTGEMLWYAMTGVWGTPLAFKITALGWSPLYHVVVNLTKMMECFLPIGFWIKRGKVRWVAFSMGLLFHTLVDMLLYIWWFAVLIPAYIVFFDPEEIYNWLKRWSSRVPVTNASALRQTHTAQRYGQQVVRGGTE